MSHNLQDIPSDSRLLQAFLRTNPPLKKLWEQVKEIEDRHIPSEGEIGELRATMIVNFGKEGRYAIGVVEESQSTIQMFMLICEFFIDKQSVK